MPLDVKTATFVLLCCSSCGYAMQLVLKQTKVHSAPEHRERVVATHASGQIVAAHATFPLESGLYMERASRFEEVFASNESVFIVNVKKNVQGGDKQAQEAGEAVLEDNGQEHHSADIVEMGADNAGELLETGDVNGDFICQGVLHHRDFHNGKDEVVKAKCGRVNNATLASMPHPQTILFANINDDGDHEIAAQQIVDVANEDMLVVLSGGVAVDKVFPVLSKSTKSFMVTKSGQHVFRFIWWIVALVVIAIAAAILSIVTALAIAVVSVAKATAYAAIVLAASVAASAISVGAAAAAVAAGAAAVTAATATLSTAAAIGVAIYEATHRRRVALPKPATNPEEATQVSAVCHELMDLDLSNLVHSNLGGVGPDGGDELIRYRSVATVDGKSIDLIIMAIGEYATPAKDKQAGNGKGGSIKRIFQKSGTRMELQFAFIDASTNKPQFMDNVQFSFMDIDGFPNGDVEENILVCDATDVCLTENTHVQDNGLDDDNCRWYKPKTLQATANPTDVDQMSDDQKGHSLTVKVQKSAGFRLVSEVTNGNSNRAILFAGKGVACPQRTCTAKTQIIDWVHAFDQKGWVAVPGVMTGLKRSGCHGLSCIEEAVSANLGQDSCYVANWWSSFDREGWSTCADGYYLSGLHRNGCNDLWCLEEAYCCKQALSSGYAGGCTNANWKDSFDKEGYSTCPDHYAMAGFYRSSGNDLRNIEEAKCCPFRNDWNA
jgi:hypothetical protein